MAATYASAVWLMKRSIGAEAGKRNQKWLDRDANRQTCVESGLVRSELMGGYTALPGVHQPTVEPGEKAITRGGRDPEWLSLYGKLQTSAEERDSTADEVASVHDRCNSSFAI